MPSGTRRDRHGGLARRRRLSAGPALRACAHRHVARSERGRVAALVRDVLPTECSVSGTGPVRLDVRAQLVGLAQQAAGTTVLRSTAFVVGHAEILTPPLFEHFEHQKRKRRPPPGSRGQTIPAALQPSLYKQHRLLPPHNRPFPPRQGGGQLEPSIAHRIPHVAGFLRVRPVRVGICCRAAAVHIERRSLIRRLPDSPITAICKPVRAPRRSPASGSADRRAAAEFSSRELASRDRTRSESLR